VRAARFYGGCLISIIIRHAEGRNPAHLAALLRRQVKLKGVCTGKEDESISGLCQAIVQSCCEEVEFLFLNGSDEGSIMTQQGLDLLAGALEADGALPKLRVLVIACALPPGGLSKLAIALAGGTAPSLRIFHFDATECNEDDLGSIADMLESRALIPSCKKLDSLVGLGNDHCFDEATLETEIRLLRALLPFTKALPAFAWGNSFEACFLEAPAPYLTCIEVALQGDVGVFSWRVLEAAPALVSILIGCVNQMPNGTRALQSINTTLRNGSLQKLEELAMITFV
jgi:hypothetical protein